MNTHPRHPEHYCWHRVELGGPGGGPGGESNWVGQGAWLSGHINEGLCEHTSPQARICGDCVSVFRGQRRLPPGTLGYGRLRHGRAGDGPLGRLRSGHSRRWLGRAWMGWLERMDERPGAVARRCIAAGLLHNVACMLPWDHIPFSHAVAGAVAPR